MDIGQWRTTDDISDEFAGFHAVFGYAVLLSDAHHQRAALGVVRPVFLAVEWPFDAGDKLRHLRWDAMGGAVKLDLENSPFVAAVDIRPHRVSDVPSRFFLVRCDHGAIERHLVCRLVDSHAERIATHAPGITHAPSFLRDR